MGALENILEINQAYLGFSSKDKDISLLDNINLIQRRGELTGLLGRNGSGKSTLLRTIVRLHNLSSGSIALDQRNFQDFESLEFARMVAYVSPGLEPLGAMTVRELVALGRFPYTNWIGSLSNNDQLILEKSMKLVGIDALADRRLEQISDGEKQKAMIARTLAQETRIIVLDEPTAFLDLPSKYDIISILHDLTRQGISVIYSTHDLNIALRFSDKIWLIEGNNILQGAPEDLIINGSVTRIFQSQRIVHNLVTGDFDIKPVYGHSLSLDCDNPIIEHWTSLALQRSGFNLVNKSPGIPHIEVSAENDKIIWKILRFNDNLVFESIYDLLAALNNQNSGK